MVATNISRDPVNPLEGIRESFPDKLSFLRVPQSIATGERISTDIVRLDQTASARLADSLLGIKFYYTRLSSLDRSEFTGHPISIAVKSIGLVPELSAREATFEFPKGIYNPLEHRSTLLVKKADFAKVKEIIHELGEKLGCAVDLKEGCFGTRLTNTWPTSLYPSREIGFISPQNLLHYQDQAADYTTFSFMLTPKNLSAVYSTKNAGVISDFWSEVLENRFKRQTLQTALSDIEKIASSATAEYSSAIKSKIDQRMLEKAIKLGHQQSAIRTIKDINLSESIQPWSTMVESEKTIFEFNKLSLTAEKASQGRLSGTEIVGKVAQSLATDLYEKISAIPELQGKFRVSADFEFYGDESFMSSYEDIYFGNRHRKGSLRVSIKNEEISQIDSAGFDKLKDTLQSFIAGYSK